MTPPEEFFIELTKEIPDAKAGKMFSALCMKMPNGKCGAMFWRDHIVVKLKGGILSEVTSLDGVRVFEPMEDRPMKGWIQVPFEHKSSWLRFAEASANLVRSIEKKPAKKKK